MRRFLALALLLVMAFSLMLISCGGDDATTTTGKSEEEIKALETKVEKLLESKHKLTFNDDGSFRVLILADTHMTVEADVLKIQELRNRIKLLVDREKPDLVIFTGDNTIRSSNEVILRRNLAVLVGYLEEKQIPWCHVYGNHDHENALSKEEQQKIYESYEYCVSKTNPEGVYISGVGNYVNAVYNKDGSIGAVIYCLDSGTYFGDGYDYIKASQISWYKETSELIQEYNGGKVVPGIMAFHIPLKENTDAYNNRDNKKIVLEYSGGKNENISSSAVDTNLLETAFERGDIKAIVTGHDHVNDYMYNYKGIKLASSPNFSDLAYTSSSVQGARVFDLNLSTIDNVVTYVSYIKNDATE
jgi:3',5'-cyclic AMP phosphodiesterase CpdA